MRSSPISNSIYDKTHYIFGMGRSGTSLLYKILHSCDMVMADYEPPVMQICVGVINEYDDNRDDIVNIFKTYLGEELFINYLLARKLNRNVKEFSSIYDVKETKFINFLKSKYKNRHDVESAIKDWKILIKLPNLNMNLVKLISPKSKIVLTRRNPDDVLSSALRKGWYCDEYLMKRPSWPFEIVEGFPVPFWVSEELTETWVKGDEIDRALVNYYEIQKVLNLMRKCRLCEDIYYEKLVSEPELVLDKIFNFLEFEQGPKTAALIRDIGFKTQSKISPKKWNTRNMYHMILNLESN